MTDAQRNDSVWLRVAGARDYTGGEAGARELALQPGDNYAKVSDAAEGIPKAYPSALSPQPSALSPQRSAPLALAPTWARALPTLNPDCT